MFFRSIGNGSGIGIYVPKLPNTEAVACFYKLLLFFILLRSVTDERFKEIQAYT